MEKRPYRKQKQSHSFPLQFNTSQSWQSSYLCGFLGRRLYRKYVGFKAVPHSPFLSRDTLSISIYIHTCIYAAGAGLNV